VSTRDRRQHLCQCLPTGGGHGQLLLHQAVQRARARVRQRDAGRLIGRATVAGDAAAYCDYCGERIEDCTKANVAYDSAEGGPAA
jgi:hypothetical protein